MIDRAMLATAKGAFARFPAIAILGPRQSGKTTLAKMAFPELAYANLEDPPTRAFASADPVGFMARYADGAIFDEIQHVPALFSFLQVRMDAAGRDGQYVLTGSHQFNLMESIAQSLAGRVALLKLLPFSLAELAVAHMTSHQSLDEVIFRGGYPRAWRTAARADEVYLSYLETYVERDVRLLLNIKDSDLFRRFLMLIASRSGQLLNKDSLGRDAGLNTKTVDAWLAVLEASFVVAKLQPYHANLGKRLIKSPKIYMLDTGLACHLLRIERAHQLTTHPLRGELFETLIVSELLKMRFNAGRAPNLYFYRDSADREVDVILEYSDGIYPIEIKASQTYHESFATNLRPFASKSPLGQAVVLGGGAREQRGDLQVIPWQDWAGHAQALEL